MMMVDVILILFILLGAVLGFKKGAIKSLVALVGTIAIIIISYYLKNPVANLLLKYAPFMELHGEMEGLVTLNILLYEGIAYVIVFAILSGILGFLINLSGIVEKILDATIILGIPSKIIGAVLGFVEAVAFSFIVLFVMLQINSTHNLVAKSSLAMSIIDKTPVLKTMVSDTYAAIREISDLQDKYKDVVVKDQYNQEILKIMLNYQVVEPDVALDLVESGKLDFVGAKAVIETYKEENK